MSTVNHDPPVYPKARNQPADFIDKDRAAIAAGEPPTRTQATQAMKRIITALDHVISGAETVCIVGFTAAALMLGVMQVVLRYGFNTGLTWAEAVFAIFTVAGMMFAGSRAVRDDKHVRVDIASHLFSPRIARAFESSSLLVCLALTGYFAYCGAR